MLKFTDKDLHAMNLEDLRSLVKRAKVAEKTHRHSLNQKLASTLTIGDKIEFTLPKSTSTQTGIISKVKRVMIAIKAVDNSAQWNVPLTSVVKKISSASVKAVKSTKTTTSKQTPSSKKKSIKSKVIKSNVSLVKAIKDKVAAKKAAGTSSTPIVASDVASNELVTSE